MAKAPLWILRWAPLACSCVFIGLIARTRWFELDDSAIFEGGVDLVVVAGAWRYPDGELSTTFRLRANMGAMVALRRNAKVLFFTGGEDDGRRAAEYALHGILLAGGRVDEHSLEGRYIKILAPMTNHDPPESGDRPLIIAYENESRTTAENGKEAANWARNWGPSFPDPLCIAVVSSPYHMKRSVLLFRRAFGRNAALLAFPSPGSSLEWVPPSRWSSDDCKGFSRIATFLNSWKISLRLALLSWEPFCKVREAGAFLKALWRGDLQSSDVW